MNRLFKEIFYKNVSENLWSELSTSLVMEEEMKNNFYLLLNTSLEKALDKTFEDLGPHFLSE